MDFGGELFWVVMLIFYLVFQVLGARKKKEQQRKRRSAGPQAEPATTEPRESTELDEALSEIRRALGFPDEQRDVPAEEPRRPVEKPLEERSAGSEPTRLPPVRREPMDEPSRDGEAAPVSPPRRKPIEGRSLRNEPTRLPPPRTKPSEVRSLRNEPSRIPPVRREWRYPERRTAMPGGSIYAANEKAKFEGTKSFEWLDEKRPSLEPESRSRALRAEAQPDPTQEARVPALVKRLQTPASAREAVLLKEILDLPRALRRGR